jgi:hypothetical protein
MAQLNRRSRARRSLAAWVAVAVVAATLLIPGSAALAGGPTNMVLEWNLNAILTIGNPNTPPETTPPTPPGLGQGPPVSPLHLAMVHGAIYDAVNAIDGSREPYLDGLTAPRSASKAAAVATAAHHVLIGLIPAETLPQVVASVDRMYAASLAKVANGRNKAAGITVGAAAAAAMLADRVGDGRFGSHVFETSTVPGKWRLVPPANTNSFGWNAFVKPFTMTSPDQFRTAGPLDLTSAAYATEFNEVKALGGKVGSSRTDAQTTLANFVSANPLPYMNKAFRELASKRALSTRQQARLFAMTSMASADALIACWNDKDHYLFWRPQTAIQLADQDGNPATEADPEWVSLFPTPGYPDHPSGYNCYTAAMMQSARAFFRTDRVSFDLTSPGIGTPITRHYRRFTDVIRDTINGRIYTGFHFRTPDVQGALLGKQVAQWGNSHFFGLAD